MGLYISIMGTVAAVMAWVVQRQNAGILNVVFIKDPAGTGTDPEFKVNENLPDSALDYLKNMLLLQRLDLSVLEALPQSVGGGQAAVNEAHEHPNREAHIFWITVGIFLLAISVLILIQLINCCCRKKKEPFERKQSRNKQFIFRTAYIAFFVITFAFLAVSIILLILYFGNVGLVVTYLESNSTSPSQDPTAVSLPEALRYVIKQVSTFLTDGVDFSRKITDSTVNRFVDDTTNKLSEESSALIDKLISYLNILIIISEGDKAISFINEYKIANDASKTEVDELKKKLEEFDKQVKESVELYDTAFSKVDECDQSQECKTLKDQTSMLRSPINITELDTSVISDFGNDLNKTSTELSTKINDIELYLTEIRASNDKIIDSVASSLDLGSTLKSIDEVWVKAEQKSALFLNDIQGLINSVEKELPTYVNYIRIGYYVAGGLILLLLIIAIFIAARFIYRAIREMRSGSMADSKRDNVVCGRCSVCCCSALLMPILFVFAAVIAVLLFSLATISGEGCIYLVQEKAINMTDIVGNSLIATEWKEGMEGSLTNGTGNLLNPFVPKNVLRALTTTCNYGVSDQSQGFLLALGYQNLVNTSELVSSQEILDGIAQGKIKVVKEVNSLDITSKLPSEAYLTDLMEGIENATDNFDLMVLIELLDLSKLNTADLNALLNSMNNFANANPTNANDFSLANRALKNAIDAKTDLEPVVELTRQSLQNLDSTKSNILIPINKSTALLSSAIKVAATLQTKVEDEYDILAKDLRTFMESDGDVHFTAMTEELLPCKEAGAAYSALMGVTCGDEGGVSHIFGLSFILALNVLFLAFLYFALFNLAFLQALRIGITTGSHSSESEGQFIDEYSYISDINFNRS